MSSPVAFRNIDPVAKDSVIAAVHACLDDLGWADRLKGRRVFLKINLLSQEVVPGQCTSPWVFEGVLSRLAQHPDLELLYGDADVAASRQVAGAVVNWGIKSVGDRYGARFVNLSAEPTRKVSLGPIFQNISLPEILLETDSLVTIPVAKTHCITPFTGALKNQWGLLPRARFQYHAVVHEAIAEIMTFFSDKLAFGVVDLTVGMEGPGPRVGIPKVCDAVMASNDLVALDSALATYMGIPPEEVGFIRACAAAGVGFREFDVEGDPFRPNPFLRGKGRDYLIYRWRDRFQRLPILKDLLFTVGAYRVLGWLATQYYLRTWFKNKGRPYARDICRTTGYGDEFGPLIGD